MALVAIDHPVRSAVWLGTDGQPDVENALKQRSQPAAAPTRDLYFPKELPQAAIF
jgi:hypothetical protein